MSRSILRVKVAPIANRREQNIGDDEKGERRRKKVNKDRGTYLLHATRAAHPS